MSKATQTVRVRTGTGGVFPDGTTNHPPIDFEAATDETAARANVQPLSEDEEAGLRRMIAEANGPDDDSWMRRLFATLDATRDEIPVAYRAGRDATQALDRERLRRALDLCGMGSVDGHSASDWTEALADEYERKP